MNGVRTRRGSLAGVRRLGSYPAAALRVLGVVVRDPSLRRIEAAFALFSSAEWATWLAMIVFAYGQGGATEAGIVAAVQLLPAVLVAPLAASIGDRRPPGRALFGTYAVQAICCLGGGVALASDLPTVVVYALLIPATVSFTCTRPLHSTFAPALARSPDMLTATNVVSGWIAAISVFVAPAIAGVLLAVASPAWVFFVMGPAVGVGALLVAPLRNLVAAADDDPAEPDGSLSGLHAIAHERSARLLVSLLAAQGLLIGALDVMYVELSHAELHRSGSWAGYLNAAFGAGGVLAIFVTALLVGRPRLGPSLAAAVAAASAALVGVALGPGAGGLMLMLVLVGGALSTFDVAARTLLQRAAPTNLLARIFGIAEGLAAAAIAGGALLGAALVDLGGAALCAIGLAVVLPLVVLLSGRRLLEIDRHADVPVVEIGLLRSMSLFGSLPPPALEVLARALVPHSYTAGAVVIRQGEPGDAFHAIADGEAEVTRDGEHVGTLGRGDGFGELALLLDRPRNATVTAVGRLRTYTLTREQFIPAVTGHPRAAEASSELVRRRIGPGAPLPDTS
jgi:MFS family permease